MQRPVYCFIDDSPIEIRLFRDIFEPITPEIHFIYASTFRDCHRQLAQQNLYPSLFILDLYGREGKRTGVRMPTRDLIAAQLHSIPDIDGVFSGLDSFSGDKDLQVNEYLKRLFSIVNIWRNIFTEQCAYLDQGRSYGVNNLQQASELYPFASAVMYTRKGLFADAVDVMRYECDGIFIKPMGISDDDIYTETKSQSNHLLDAWHESVRNRYVHVLEKNSTLDPHFRKLAKCFSLTQVEMSGRKEEWGTIRELIDSMGSMITTSENVSTLFTNTLSLWARFYYG